jgi:hypothetical protein
VFVSDTGEIKDLAPSEALAWLVQKHEHDKEIRDAILQMRSHAFSFTQRNGLVWCRGPYGLGIASKKEAELLNVDTQEVLRNGRFRRHLDASYAAVRWAVLGSDK